MTTPIETSGPASGAQPDGTSTSVQVKKIEGRSPGRIAWTRLKRDKVALAGGAVVVLLILAAVFAPVLTALFGHPIDEPHPDQINPDLGLPKGAFGGMSGDYLLGVDPVFGRDVFSRIVYGARISLLVAFLAAALSVCIGVVMGVMAGYFGGWVDSVISRVMDVLLAFPQLLFSIALVSVMPNQLLGLNDTGVRVLVLVSVIGFFGWPYIGRIVRGQAMSLREREFVDAARSLGAGRAHILFRELLPNLTAPILVYATLIIPTNILNEAALSFLGAGVRPPTPSWGQMLSDAVGIYQADPTYMVIPGLAIFITVLAFNLFGDGLRDALDPKGN
ncbi:MULTISPECIES: ABC transporter permease [Kitasatospora]|uniref:Putative peptide ABC transporter permease protein n=1 Tax=Kitasatospora setae (strain ATCC 33774 / DSM 43861 / JCM 3304 / KCC A-0304 / NBRC 14216 / KM-6054) TaxID=452652 RepID=E4NH90_KITSK|nr:MULTISPECIES: ABC transporter permease [Kitasatospora]BAJ30870.1 putative peptide ABC transporter permease protein [Kitasatospora setae KM-6054]